MSDVYEIKSPFLRQAIEQRGIMDDLVTDLLIVERYLRHPERTDAVAAEGRTEANPQGLRELIVVDDGSTDCSAAIAESMGVRVVSHAQRRGCGDARNTGVDNTTAQILVFVDSDVVIAPDALERIISFLVENPNYAAVFGSYDSKPGDPGFVSQYRNLLHRFVHQNGNRDAETFWTGLGAVRREAFQSVGGFRRNCPSIADVLLGLDLSDAAFRIRIDPNLVGKHLKRWSLRSMVTTDVFLRAAPWTSIILARGQFTNDLNTSLICRIGVVSANVAVASLLMATFIPVFWAIATLALIATLVANFPVLKQFRKERGVLFTLQVVPVHIVHQLCSSAGFAIGLTRYYFGKSAHITRLDVSGLALDQPSPLREVQPMIVVAAEEGAPFLVSAQRRAQRSAGDQTEGEGLTWQRESIADRAPEGAT